MMTSAQVTSLARDGFSIGGHTIDHPILARLDFDSARKQIVGGKLRLEEIVGSPITLFAYPNGRPGHDYTLQTTELVRSLALRRVHDG